MNGRVADSVSPPLLPPGVRWAAPSLSRLYGFAAAWRRRRFDRPQSRRWLRQPVISVGNLAVGGRGKTPIVAWIARHLLASGERPAILTRGYGRACEQDGVVVVSDGTAIRAPLAATGDEPLMLARMLPGCAVLVAPDRHLAGVLAESRLGCTVHVLDDGFQHLTLARDVDLLLVDQADMTAGRPLPAGLLRESRETARFADAWLVESRQVDDTGGIAQRWGVSNVFGVSRQLEPPCLVDDRGRGAPVPASARFLLVSGLARPDRFRAEVEAAGWPVVGHLAFPDHHRFDAEDVRRIANDAARASATVVLTTPKDLVRLEAFQPWPFALAVVDVRATIVQECAFLDWLRSQLLRSRDARAHAGIPS